MAGPSQYRPPVVHRPTSADEDGHVRNISTGLMKPLYTSCSEHYHQQQKNNNNPTASRFLTLNTLPRMPATEPVRQAGSTSSPFMRLPTEIRLQIYSLLLLPRNPNDLLPAYEKVSSSTQDYFDYDKKRLGTDRPITADLSNPTLRIRTIDPTRYKGRFPSPGRHCRSGYSVRADRFNARCMETTYHCVNIPFFEHNISILRVNRQIHTETTEILYGSYTFDFDTHIEAIIPFLSDLTPFARSCIKGVRIVKRALPYIKEFDKCEWHNALRFITCTSNNINLRKLELGVVAGRPGENGWDRVPRYTADDFKALLMYSEGMEWLQYLLDIRGLQELDIEAVVEHCPPCTTSSAMAKFVRFSASVDSGFADFLKARLLGGAAA